MMAQDSGPVIRGKHVLLAMLTMFGIVIAVNMVFVYLALDTFTGVSRENPYQDGLTYNRVLAERDAQRDLGWQGAVTLSQAGSEDSVTLALQDATGAPLRGLEVTGMLRRPTHEGLDQELLWREQAPGRYTARVALPQRGNWDLLVNADDGSNPPLQMKTRLWFR